MVENTSQFDFYENNNSQPFIKCRELKNKRINNFASDNNQTLLIENNGNIKQFNNTDLLQNWNIQLGNKLDTIPFLSGTDFLLISREETDRSEKQQTIIRHINSLTGITDWMIHFEKFGYLLTNIDEDNKNITFISDDLDIRAIDSNNGKILWQIHPQGKLKSFTNSNNSLILLTTEDKLLRINLQDGTLKTENKISIKNVSEIYLDSDRLYLGDIKGNLYGFSEKSNSIKKLFRTGGEISFIGSDGTNLLVSSNDNFLYFYSPEKEKVLWKKRLSGRVVLDPIIFQNSIFVTTSAESLIYILKRTDGTLTNQINIGQNQIIKKFLMNDTGLDVLTADGLLKFSIVCQNQKKTGQI